MSDDNIRSLSDKRIERLKSKGSYWGLLDEYEILRLKFYYEPEMSKREALRFIELCKYFMQNGHSESFKLSCKYMYDKFMAKCKI